MKKLIRFSAFILAAAALICSCTTEELSTDQFSDQGLMFSAFAPNPVFRGGELTILGSNLDQVKEVLIPGVDAITNFTVSGTGRQCKLTFIVPVDGPEVGNVSIVGKNGELLTSLAELTYTEPIVFTSFSPAEAMPGDVLTIKGDYLNLVNEVIFEGGVIVNEFMSRSRYELSVMVPSNAITGRLIVGDSDELLDPDTIANKIYSETELVIGDPTVDKADKATVKYQDEITVTGKYLDMISSVTVGGAEQSDFALSDNNTKLTFLVPDLAADGEIILTDFAGKEFSAGEIETVIPTELTAKPQPVKAGKDLVISGKDLDLVTKVDFANAADQAFTYDAGTGDITVVMDPKATEGDATLTLANGKTVTVAYTLVMPTVTKIDPVQLMAGGDITVTGTDLDLITGATLGGKEIELKSMSEDGKELILTTSNTSVSGKIVLALANGTTVEPEDEISLTYDSFIIVNEIPSSAPIGSEVVMKGENFNMIENIYIGEQKVTSYLLRMDDELHFIMPFNKVGVYSIKFQLFSGEEETCPSQIEVTLEEQTTVIWEGSEDMGSWSNQPYLGDEKAFVNAQVGDKVRIYYTPYNDWYNIQLFDGHWGALSVSELGGGQEIKPDTVPEYKGYFEFEITGTLLAQLYNPQDWGGAMLVQGEGCIVTMITSTHFVPQEKVLWEGSEDLGSWSNQPTFGAEGALSALGVKVGDLVRIYFTPNADFWQFQVFGGHWEGITMEEVGGNTVNPDTTSAKSCYEFKLTQELFDVFDDTQGWGGAILLQGESCTITKVAFF